MWRCVLSERVVVLSVVVSCEVALFGYCGGGGDGSDDDCSSGESVVSDTDYSGLALFLRSNTWFLSCSFYEFLGQCY